MSSPPTPSVPFEPAGRPAGAARLFGQFTTEVARWQLDEWLAPQPQTILDLSVRSPPLLALMLERGHTVLRVDDHPPHIDIAPAAGQEGPGRLHTVLGDPHCFDWLGAATVDSVVAEGGALSGSLAAELTIEDLHRVLRPGGGLLVCVDSLVAGLSQLADQGRWAELADLPAADVVLVPDDGDSVFRCFWPEELHGMLAAAGFDVEWVRPRTVLTEETVSRALAADPGRLSTLVAIELALAARRQGESIGAHLVASARKRAT